LRSTSKSSDQKRTRCNAREASPTKCHDKTRANAERRAQRNEERRASTSARRKTTIEEHHLKEVVNEAQRVALKRGLYLWRKGLFKFKELVSVPEDGD
jgi:hypothetical protein